MLRQVKQLTKLVYVWTIVAFGTVLAGAETLVTEAKILEVTERGFILKVGTEPLVVEDSPETRLWKGYVQAKRDAFAKDEAVGVRVKTDTDPPLLREMADASTWNWLLKIRKEPMKGTIEKVDARSMLVKFADGRSFEYRHSEKTKVNLAGKSAALSDLESGKSVYLKGARHMAGERFGLSYSCSRDRLQRQEGEAAASPSSKRPDRRQGDDAFASVEAVRRDGRGENPAHHLPLGYEILPERQAGQSECPGQTAARRRPLHAGQIR
jgi:hypothetical protein